MADNQPSRRKIIFSGIQPSGQLTLGNLLGALKNWADLQDTHDCVYSVVDLHAITVRQDPAKLRQQILSTYALVMACGIDAEKSILFIQSHVSAHAELAWILSCYTQFGELSRMTQFKDKSARHTDNVNVGLFAYPSLQAADILLYQADRVPVGADQKQHLELSRDIATRFNGLYGETFTLPEPYIPTTGARVMSLQDPTSKMSKSDENQNAYVALLDDADTILRKFKRAVTDSEAVVRVGEGKDGINNLIGIYSALTGQSPAQIEAAFEGKGYGDFKAAVGECVAEALRPIRERYDAFMTDNSYLESCYRAGAERAQALAARTLQKAQRKIGLVKR